LEIEAALFDYSAAQAAAGLSERIREYFGIMAQMATDQTMKDLSKTYSEAPPDPALNAITFNLLFETLSRYLILNSSITAVTLVNNSGDAIQFSRTEPQNIYISRSKSSNFYHAFLKYGTEAWLNGVNVSQAANEPGALTAMRRQIYFTYPAADIVSRKIYGVFILEVNNTVFTDILYTQQNNTAIINRHINRNSGITNLEGAIVFSPAVSNIGQNIKTIQADPGIMVRSAPIKGSNLVLHLFFNHGLLMQYKNKYRDIIIIFMLLSMIVFSIIIVPALNRLMARSEKIAAAISRFRRNRQRAVLDIEPNDEVLSAIAGEFTAMSGEIEKLIRELNKKNERIRQAKDHQRQAEIQALQAQINPHFILKFMV
jgi:two-component system sensor histidine kinase YesM